MDKYCKIYQNNNGCYGFTEGNLDKSSLTELVDHYSRESLKEHNPTLDIRLLYPVFEGHDDNAGVYLHMQHDWAHCQRLHNPPQILQHAGATQLLMSFIVGWPTKGHQDNSSIYAQRIVAELT